ncbi:MAG: hypothetical protein ABSB35_35340, partial [Bryobacteraceae bacterium]
VAFICDFLKRNNEQLRELTIELKVRQEETQRRQTMTARVAQTAAPTAAAKPPAQPVKKAFENAHAVAAPRERKRVIAPEALAAMERGAQRASVPRPKAPAPAAAGSPAPAETVLDAVPAGFHEGYVLSQLVKSKRPVSGLVVSIGVNAGEGHSLAPDAAKELIQSLIGPADFACQSSPEEFLLICPSEQGAAAQRRLNQIAEQLWNFQLRSMGNFSILFSWGGLEVHSESIDEAVASANERMKETRRGRKLLMMESRGSRTPVRQAG